MPYIGTVSRSSLQAVRHWRFRHLIDLAQQIGHAPGMTIHEHHSEYPVKRYLIFLTVFIFAASWAAAQEAGADPVQTFRVIKFDGRCEVRTDDGDYADLQRQAYPYGVTLKTGRHSFILVEVSPGNTFQLMARTALTIEQSKKDPRLKRIRMNEGGVSLLLDKWPRGHKLDVETPSAVCGAVGTRFVVSVEPEIHAKDGSIAYARQSFRCDEGMIELNSRFEIADATVRGQSLQAAAIPEHTALAGYIHEGLENAYVDLTVNRGSLAFTFGGQQSFVAEAEKASTRFVCAFQKSEEKTDLIALKVEAGAITKRISGIFGRQDQRITAIDRPVLLAKKKLHVYTNESTDTPVEDYIAAAREEGNKQAEILFLESTGGDRAVIHKKRQELQQLATKATELREKLQTERVKRMLRSIRHGNRRSRR